VHVVCNNAGVAVAGRVDKMDYKDWNWVMRTDLARFDIDTFVLCPGELTTNVSNSGRNRSSTCAPRRSTSRLRIGHDIEKTTI
jgi:short-subunit dehydrogenase